MKSQDQTKLLIEIPLELKRDLKIAAAKRDTTMKGLVQEGLRWVLDPAQDLTGDGRGGGQT